jgi:hypothetical protein
MCGSISSFMTALLKMLSSSSQPLDQQRRSCYSQSAVIATISVASMVNDGAL